MRFIRRIEHRPFVCSVRGHPQEIGLSPRDQYGGRSYWRVIITVPGASDDPRDGWGPEVVETSCPCRRRHETLPDVT